MPGRHNILQSRGIDPSPRDYGKHGGISRGDSGEALSMNATSLQFLSATEKTGGQGGTFKKGGPPWLPAAVAAPLNRCWSEAEAFDYCRRLTQSHYENF